MDAQRDIWIQNITLLGEEFGSKKELAAKVGVTSSYMYQITNHAKSVSNKAVRRIESKTGLPRYLLDKPVTANTLRELLKDKTIEDNSAVIDYKILVECVNDALAVSSLEPSDTGILARVIAALYESRTKRDHQAIDQKDAS